jgi:hypothetical protein
VGPPVDDERLYRVVHAMDDIAAESGRSIPQVAIAWFMSLRICVRSRFQNAALARFLLKPRVKMNR